MGLHISTRLQLQSTVTHATELCVSLYCAVLACERFTWSTVKFTRRNSQRLMQELRKTE